MSSITDNVSAQFLQDLRDDIYQIFAGIDNEWIAEGIVNFTFGVPGARGLPNIQSSNNPLGPNSTTPRFGDDKAEFDLNQRVITSIDRMARLELDPDKFIETFEPIRSKGLLNALQLNPNLRSAILDSFKNAVASSTSKTFSIGTGGDLTFGSFNWLVGFFPLISTDVDTIRSEFIPAANPVIDTTNIFPIMEKMIQDLPARLDKKLKPTKFTMSLDTFKLLQQANRENGVTSVTYLEIDNKPTFAGYAIKVISDLPPDFIFLTPQDMSIKSNLVVSGWVKGDSTALNIYKESEGDQVFQGVLRFQAGVQIRAAEDTIWYASQVLVP